jgi:predicted RNase H-like HicB family nuclease
MKSKKEVVQGHFTLEYWQDDGWYVGRLKEIPNIFSQGETLTDLEKNIRDAYWLMLERNLSIGLRHCFV